MSFAHKWCFTKERWYGNCKKVIVYLILLAFLLCAFWGTLSGKEIVDYIEADGIEEIVIKKTLEDGNAYYSWGTTQRFAAALRVDSKYPYKRNASGTYEYRYPSKTYPTKNSSTPGYYGNATLYASIIQLYNNTIGYFTHDESIDVTSAVASMLS